MNNDNSKFVDDSTVQKIIIILSVAIPVVVALLLFLPQTGKMGDLDVSFLPHLNGILNTATALCLMLGFYFIKNGNKSAHKVCMLSAFFISSLFLISYVLYHFQAAPTRFGGEGFIRAVYYFLLISHILLAVAVVPLVLFSIYYALSGKIDSHKKIVKWSFPVWLYVSVTGVIVYLMISPYYA